MTHFNPTWRWLKNNSYSVQKHIYSVLAFYSFIQISLKTPSCLSVYWYSTLRPLQRVGYWGERLLGWPQQVDRSSRGHSAQTEPPAGRSCALRALNYCPLGKVTSFSFSHLGVKSSQLYKWALPHTHGAMLINKDMICLHSSSLANSDRLSPLLLGSLSSAERNNFSQSRVNANLLTCSTLWKIQLK